MYAHMAVQGEEAGSPEGVHSPMPRCFDCGYGREQPERGQEQIPNHNGDQRKGVALLRAGSWTYV